MIRNLKVLGLAMVAVLAMSAMVASAASAHEFKSEAASTQLTGKQVGEHVFTAEGNEVKCTTATFNGTQSGTEADEVTIHPEYGKGLDPEGNPGKCRFSALTATVTTTGCDYKFDSETSEAGHATTQVVCAEKSNITISLSGCTITIGAQTVDGGVSFDNEGSGTTQQVKVTATATGIDYSASGFGCSLAGIKTGAHSDGTYNGTTTVTGEKPSTVEHVGISVG
jgi:hypothetical protein